MCYPIRKAGHFMFIRNFFWITIALVVSNLAEGKKMDSTEEKMKIENWFTYGIELGKSYGSKLSRKQDDSGHFWAHYHLDGHKDVIILEKGTQLADQYNYYPSGDLKSFGKIYVNINGDRGMWLFSNGKLTMFPVGVWKYFDKNGKLERTEDLEKVFSFTLEQLKATLKEKKIQGDDYNYFSINRTVESNSPQWVVEYRPTGMYIQTIKISAKDGRILSDSKKRDQQYFEKMLTGLPKKEYNEDNFKFGREQLVDWIDSKGVRVSEETSNLDLYFVVELVKVDESMLKFWKKTDYFWKCSNLPAREGTAWANIDAMTGKILSEGTEPHLRCGNEN